MFLALSPQDVVLKVTKWCDKHEFMYPSNAEMNDLIAICERNLVRKLTAGKSVNYHRELRKLLTRLLDSYS